MKFSKFIDKYDLTNLTELERTKMTMFYERQINSKDEISIDEITFKLEDSGFARINKTRLIQKIKKSKDFAKGKSKSNFKLSVKCYKELTAQNSLSKKNEDIIAEEAILPESLFKSTRGYIEKISLQINSTYETNCFDATAVCMRRLLEVMLILTYEKNGKQNEIKDGAVYKNLSTIINYTKSNNQFNLSKGTIDIIDEFRQLGNLSAHRIQYNCRKSEIDKVKREYRATIEELLYKSSIK